MHKKIIMSNFKPLLVIEIKILTLPEENILPYNDIIITRIMMIITDKFILYKYT